MTEVHGPIATTAPTAATARTATTAGTATTAYNYVWQRRGVGRLSAAKKRVVCVACVVDNVQCCAPSSSLLTYMPLLT